MSIRIFKTLILFNFLIFSCNEVYKGHKHEIIPWDDQVELEFVKEISFPVAEDVTNRGLSAQLYTAERNIGPLKQGVDYLVYFNNAGYDIIFYNYLTRKEVYRTKLKKVGPNGVGSNVNYVNVIKDNMVLAFTPAEEMIYFLDFQGNLIEKLSSTLYDSPDKSILLTGKLNLLKNGNTLHMPVVSGRLAPQNLKAAIQDDLLKQTTATMTLGSNEITLNGEYPMSYEKGIWSRYEYRPYQSLSPSGEILYSYPIDEYIYDSKGNKFYAGSEAFNESPPITSKGNFTDNSDLEYEFHRLQNSFDILRYDPYENVFYRFVNKAKKYDDLKNRQPLYSRYKNKSVVILDGDLKKIGETELPKYSFTEHISFINQDGIHLLDFSKTFEVEDSIYFGIYKPIIKK